MSPYIKNTLKVISMHLIAVSFIVSGFAVYAFTVFPSSAPVGESAGGKFMTYFNKMLVDAGPTTDGTVKKAKKADLPLAGDDIANKDYVDAASGGGGGADKSCSSFYDNNAPNNSQTICCGTWTKCGATSDFKGCAYSSIGGNNWHTTVGTCTW